MAANPTVFKNAPQLAAALDAQMQAAIRQGQDPMADPQFQKYVQGGQIKIQNGHVVAYDPLYSNSILAKVGKVGGAVGASVATAGLASAYGPKSQGSSPSGGGGGGTGGDGLANTLYDAALDSREVFGGAAKSGAQANQNRDVLQTNLQNTQVSRDRLALDAPGIRMKNSIKAALSKNAVPSSVQWGGPGSGLRGEIPKFSGGRQSIYGAAKDPAVQSLMEQVLQDELMSQQQGGPSGGGRDSAITFEPGQTSALDKVIGGGAFGSSILAAILKNRRRGVTEGASQPTPISGGGSEMDN